MEKTILVKKDPLKLFASCPKCMEDLLEEEIKELGGKEIKPAKCGVYFTGNTETAYRICLWSRTASRLYMLLSRFEAEKKEELYRRAKEIEWIRHFDPETTFAVDCTITAGFLNNSNYAALLVKDAVADYYKEQTGRRPSVDTESPDIRINVHIHKNTVDINLDLSGDSLHKREYRKGRVEASLKENVAAAFLMRAGWRGIAENGGELFDPMCGAGTILIEGALVAADIAPGLFKKRFGFFKWKQHESAAWTSLIKEALSRKEKGMSKMQQIAGIDLDKTAVITARSNILKAGLKGKIIIHQGNIENFTVPYNRASDTGLVITNPPYGLRIGRPGKLEGLYKTLGSVMTGHFMGWKGAVITSEPELAKKTGLKAEKTNTLFNGSIKCVAAFFSITEQNIFKTYNYLDKIDISSDDFANRIKKNIKRLRKWVRKNNTTCYRLYDADLPEYAAAIDIYEGRFLHLQEYAPPSSIDIRKADKRLKHMVLLLPEILNIEAGNIFVKQRRRQKGSEQYRKIDSAGHFETVMENDLKFKVNFTDHIDTGLFLNNRMVRSRIRELARNKTFLNLFSYTGTVTVYAAHGGAGKTTSVDMSNTYNNWAKENLRLNGFDLNFHTFINADVPGWLRENRQKYDLIFLDPPTFANTRKKGLLFDLQKQHVELIGSAMNSLQEGGTLIFSNNFKKFKLDEESLGGYKIRNIKNETLPMDFERNHRIHNCWEIGFK